MPGSTSSRNGRPAWSFGGLLAALLRGRRDRPVVVPLPPPWPAEPPERDGTPIVDRRADDDDESLLEALLA